MKKTTLTILMATSFVMLTGWHGRCGRDLTAAEKKQRIQKHSERMLEDVMDDIDARDDQLAQSEVIRKRVVQAGLPMVDDHARAKSFYQSQWVAEQPDREGIHRTIDEQVEGMRKFFHVAADGVVDLHQLLDAKQRKEIAEYWE